MQLPEHEARLIAWQTLVDGTAAPAWAQRHGTRFSADGLQGLCMSSAEAVDPVRGDAPYDDYFAAGLMAQSILIALARTRPQRESYLTVLDDGSRIAPVLAAAGWRHLASEALMLAEPQPDAAAAADADIRLLTAADDVVAWNARDPEPLAWLRRENLADSRQRHYVLAVDGRPASRARSTTIDDRSYLTRVFTDPALRGRGLAARVLRRVLHDDALHGVRFNVLSADLPAVPLYERLGWRVVGRTQVFVRTAVGG
jgi:GNAT superfamily N-acetyltransferase